MYKVEIRRYKDFTTEEKREWIMPTTNGAGHEDCSYIVEINKGEIIAVNSDAMEPEDASFTRDLRWIVESLKNAYKIGFLDGNKNQCNNKLKEQQNAIQVNNTR